MSAIIIFIIRCIEHSRCACMHGMEPSAPISAHVVAASCGQLVPAGDERLQGRSNQVGSVVTAADAHACGMHACGMGYACVDGDRCLCDE